MKVAKKSSKANRASARERVEPGLSSPTLLFLLLSPRAFPETGGSDAEATISRDSAVRSRCYAVQKQGPRLLFLPT